MKDWKKLEINYRVLRFIISYIYIYTWAVCINRVWPFARALTHTHIHYLSHKMFQCISSSANERRRKNNSSYTYTKKYNSALSKLIKKSVMCVDRAKLCRSHSIFSLFVFLSFIYLFIRSYFLLNVCMARRIFFLVFFVQLLT